MSIFVEKMATEMLGDSNNSNVDLVSQKDACVPVAPLVTSQVTSSAESICTILNSFNKNNVCIPEYQRDSDQWSDGKKVYSSIQF